MKYLVASLMIIIGFSAAMLMEEKFGEKEITFFPYNLKLIEEPNQKIFKPSYKIGFVEIDILEYDTYGEMLESYFSQICDGNSPFIMVKKQNKKYLILPTRQSCEPHYSCSRGKRTINIHEDFVSNSTTYGFEEYSVENLNKVFLEQYEDDFKTHPYQNKKTISYIEMAFQKNTKTKKVRTILLDCINAHLKANHLLNGTHHFNLEIEENVIIEKN